MSRSRLFPDDEELGKKDDDFRPDQHNLVDDLRQATSPTSITSFITGPRMRRRRLVLVVGFLIFAYVFVKNIPTDLKPVGDLEDVRDPGRTIRGVPIVNQIPKAKDIPVIKNIAGGGKKTAVANGLKSEDIPAVLRGSEGTQEYTYNGPLKFYDLPASLHAITHTQGYKDNNKNVIFVAANVRSASRLIPLACEMARFDLNHVHFAFAGRDPVKLEKLKELNGASRECSVYWHDARPNESGVSSDKRMEYSVTSALYHIQTYMHPQVYITDDHEEEETYFLKGIRAHTARVGKSLIDLPTNAVERMMWLTRLDHASLAAWDTIYIDILIHVPPKTSGSLIRLLKSIQHADYFGSRVPHLTIELPSKIEPATQRFLDNFIWPPLPRAGGKHRSEITLRRRISRDHLTPMDASIRMIESFYSARPSQSHVLLLSTQAELSPLYYHYLFYNTLEYGYSSYSKNTPEQEALVGIALDLPSVKLNGKDSLVPPVAPPTVGSKEDRPPETPFYWQAPDTHAALYFGNKWQEFHDFFSRRLRAGTSQQEKLIAPIFPAFTEPLLELMRLRSWFMLYPHLPDGQSIATVHNDLSVAPEEYQAPDADSKDAEKPAELTADTPYLEPVEPAKLYTGRFEGPLLDTQLVNILPSAGDLSDLSSLPLLSWDGKEIALRAAANEAGKLATEFHRTIGHCSGQYTAMRLINTADDLFCDDPNGSSPPNAPKPAPKANKEYPPVRAGLEAAIAAAGTDIPGAFQIDTKSGKTAGKPKASDTMQDDDMALSSSGLVFDASEPPKSLDGSSTMRKDKSGFEPKVPGDIVPPRPAGLASADEKAAMQDEFKAHLDRLSKDSATN